MNASPTPIEHDATDNPITPHPFNEIFPPMSDEERKELEESIKKNGLRKKIIIDKQRRILDGLNRYRACLAVGVEPEFEVFEGTEEEARALIWDANVVRRHLPTSVKAAVGAEWTQLEQGHHRSSGNSQSVAAAAKQLGISESSIHVAKAIQRVSPELHGLVKSNLASVNAAEAISKLPQKKRDQDIQTIRSAPSKKEARARAKEAGVNAKITTSSRPKISSRTPVAGKIQMIDDEGRPLHGHYSKLLAVFKAIRVLPDELRGLRNFIVDRNNHPLSPTAILELKAAIAKLARTDFKDLIVAAEAAIGDLDMLTASAPDADSEIAQPATATAVVALRQTEPVTT